MCLILRTKLKRSDPMLVMTITENRFHRRTVDEWSTEQALFCDITAFDFDTINSEATPFFIKVLSIAIYTYIK